MKRFLLLCMLFNLVPVFAQVAPKPENATPKVVKDVYHGITVEDPYRYMEDLNDPDVVNWLRSNTDYAEAVLNTIPEKDALLEKIRELDSRTAAKIMNVSITDNDTYYYLKMTPQDESGKLYVRDGYEGSEKLLLDPEKYKDNDKTYTILSLEPNQTGDKVAVRLAPNGSENGELLILDKSGNKLEEPLDLVEVFGWLGNDHIVYTKLNSADIKDMDRQLNLKVYRHELGTAQTEDKVLLSSANNPALDIKPEEIPIIFYDKDLDRTFAFVVTVNKAAKIYIGEGDKLNPNSWKQLASQDEQVSNFALSSDAIYYLSFQDAPNFKIVRSSINDPAFSKGKVVVEEPESGPIDDLVTTKDGLFYTVKSNGVESNLYFLPKDGQQPKQIKLPFTAGYVGLSSKGPKFSDLWVNLSGWTSPSKRYKYDLASNTFTLQPLSTPADYPELENLVAKEVMVTSHDGVQVPVSLVYNKDTKLDGSNPTILYGYGSYGISTGPFFSPLLLAYTLYDGVFVVPHVRGGGELGDDWHRAGQKLNKPNTWKDAIAAAEYLIEEGYTSPEKLTIMGGSAGGIFVGRAITERPDLFAAAIPAVGAMNTVRMEETPNGPVNAPEFGTVKDPEEFKGLLEMDSYHHLKDGTEYPATLVTSGMNDPRVIAWEPAKFAARMQNANASDNPILLLTDFDSGHGIGDQKSKTFENFANMFSFSLWQSGHPKFQPATPIND
ncbi:prolyl oligopeptidase family serine peptidase [Salinimicrobium sp. TH3]|uniref:prolyl oligopeptidase family serine peptidase n=1 Tax=Salinimicrobium sp. TH3 TaxID=2997342 RepID=UPI0022730245|nr:prolyl oligopeptidase family serine peptidase [Salinimicrobium sp. TH3]MCY2687146.1 prolyl oligopeptidase family serine peptidase [Salinimicrobium sp. TH3]